MSRIINYILRSLPEMGIIIPISYSVSTDNTFGLFVSLIAYVSLVAVRFTIFKKN
ncbi:hypothetical protein UT300012_21970 [Paraclostridium bifermentans]